MKVMYSKIAKSRWFERWSDFVMTWERVKSLEYCRNHKMWVNCSYPVVFKQVLFFALSHTHDMPLSINDQIQK